MHTIRTPAKTTCRIALGIAVLTAALVTGAHATDDLKMHVNYADLNINTPAGATVLYRRIRNAATAVCGVANERDLAIAARAQACVFQAVSEAVAAVDNPHLTSVYEAKMGGAMTVKFAALH
jgi:UrcA family protein